MRRALDRKPSFDFDESGFSKLGLEAAIRASRPEGYADYLYYRLAYPSILGAIPPLLVFGKHCMSIPQKRVLDLLCGAGHASAILSAYFPELEIITADLDFVNLYLLQRYFVSHAATVCLDAELPLPFADNSIGGFFCLDGLHYVRSKIALLRESDRILAADGVWLMAHMHNAAAENVNAGAPLSTIEYSKRFTFGRRKLLSELDVLRNFHTTGCLDLVSDSQAAFMESSNAVTLVGAREDSLWVRHEGIDSALCQQPERLGFNPIYRVEKAVDGLSLKASYPSDSFRRECATEAPILPDEVHIPSRLLAEMGGNPPGQDAGEYIRELIRSFVIVPLPDAYPRQSRIMCT
jgi:SAM-dependent methyltransferase